MKKRSKKGMDGAAAPIAYKPNPKAERRSSAEYMADTMIRTHPKIKAMRNHIANAVEKAAHRAVANKASRGSFGY